MKIVYTNSRYVQCTGENHDHPKVYYTIGEKGYVICGYCNIKYVYKGNQLSWESATLAL